MGVNVLEGNKFERMVSAFELMAIAQAKDIDLSNFHEVQSIVKEGKAAEFFNIGDQIIVTWNPDGGQTEHNLPFDVVSFEPAPDASGNLHPAMWLQSHYALTGIQFDGNEAFYVPAAVMPAGTYHFSMANSWGTNVVANKVYQFTTTKEIPANGQLVLGTASSNTSGLPDTAPENWRVRTYKTGDQLDPDEVLTLTEGSEGTDLGSLSSSQKYSASGMNNMQRAAYGYNRWSQSAIRQWLNSSEAAGAWWHQMNPFDHRPDQLASVRGFRAGLPNDFLSVLKPIKVTTALNTVSDADIGASEDTMDTFFLPSLEQEYIAPQASGVEGSAWQYWIDRLDGTRHAQGAIRTEHIRYAYENHSSAQHVRLRSASRGYANSAWYVYSSGSAYYYNATHAIRPAPACVIW